MSETREYYPGREKVDDILKRVRDFATEMEQQPGVLEGMRQIFQVNKEYAIKIVEKLVMAEANMILKPNGYTVTEEDFTEGIKAQIIDMFETVFKVHPES